VVYVLLFAGIGWHLWEIDLRFAPGLPPGWFLGIKKVVHLCLGALGASGGVCASVCRTPVYTASPFFFFFITLEPRVE